MQKWWLIGAGVLGIALAVLLIPRPETDTSSDPEVSAETVTGMTAPGEGRKTRARKKGSKGKAGANPIASEVMRKRAVPEARYAAKASAPWTEIRRQLALQRDLEHPDEELDALVEEAAAMATKMNDLRRAPDKFDWATVEAEQTALLAKVRASKWATAEIESMASTLDERIVEYHEDAAKSASGPPDAPDGAEEPAATDVGATDEAPPQ